MGEPSVFFAPDFLWAEKNLNPIMNLVKRYCAGEKQESLPGDKLSCNNYHETQL